MNSMHGLEVAHCNWTLNKNHSLTSAGEYRSLPLMTAHSPFIVEYLEAMHGVMCTALEAYGRVFAFRFDLHLPILVMASAEALGNLAVSKFIASLKAKIRHNRECVGRNGGRVHDTEVRYFWVREIGNLGRVHYHFVVFLNGDAFNWLGSYQSSRPNMKNRICEAWASALGSSISDATTAVHFPSSPTYMLDRNERASVSAFFLRASYLCKAETKQYGCGHHGYGASRG
jgi:hypothetical protein